MSGFAWEILQIRQPWWLLLAAQPLIIMLYMRLQAQRKNNEYADEALLPWLLARPDVNVKRRSRKHFFLLQLVWVLFAIAMAGPRYPDPPQAVDHSNGVDVMVLLDVSRSMNATDIKPSRLKRAKAELFQILSLNKSDRLGIILFAGRPHVMSPLTWDRNALEFYAKSIKEGLMPTSGSDLTAAIKLANQQLQHSTHKAILVLTDGDNKFKAESDKSILQTPLFILGVGSYAGASIPDAESGWLMHDQQAVRTKLEDTLLKKLARDSGGAYVVMTPDMSDLNQLYLNGINRITDDAIIDANDKQAWVELYPWFLFPAALLLLSAMIDWVRLFAGQVSVFLFVFLLGGLLPMSDSFADIISVKNQLEAYRLYDGKDYQGAIEIYSRSSDFSSRMGEGASAYQLKDYASAINQFTQAFLVATVDHERADALYNLANSFFQVARYKDALSTYEDVLRYRESHINAVANRDFVKSVLKSLVDDPFYDPGKGRRAGRGPRSARVDQNAGGSGDFSLGEEEKKEQTLYTKTEPEGDALTTLSRGDKQARVADDSNAQQAKIKQKTVTAVDLLEARRIVLQAEQDQSSLWKSLFEDEEGFPAPLEQPVVLPGVLPW